MNLREKQLKLQSQTIEDFEEKMQKIIDKKSKNQKRSTKDTFSKIYLKRLSDEICTLRNKKMPKVIEKIFISDRYKSEICKLYGEESLPDYNLKEKAKNIAIGLQDKVNDKSIYGLNPKKVKREGRVEASVIKRTFEILKDKNVDLQSSIEELGLKQKEQVMSLATILLSSGEVAWITLQTLSGLLVKDLHSEDDNSTSRQGITNTIAESLFEHVAFRFKRDKLKIEAWENDTEIDVAIELFAELINLGILEEYEKDGGFLNYKFSKAFEKESRNIYNAILKYTPPSFEPMIVPPTPWTTIDDGGFLRDLDSSPKYDLSIMKSKTKRDGQNVESRRETFSPKLLKAINIIQDTKWQINSDLIDDIESHLKLLKEQAKERIKELKKEKEKRYSSLKEIKTKLQGQKELLEEMGFSEEKIDENILEKYQEQKRAREAHQEVLTGIGTLECEINIDKLTIEKAKKYAKYDEIYFVWQVDFRGRTYPAQPLLNPQGDDLAKALLRFAIKKPLGESGERWFKIHGANLYGEDKISFDDRVNWIDIHKDDILGIFANRDRFDSTFLRKADKPYGFLAFAYEYRGFIEDPDNFKSALPIAMDGSNNGFQHITALLRDKKGASKVNVLPSKDQETPNDIYKDVAIKTKELIDRDSGYIIKKDKTEIRIEKKYIDEIYLEISRDLTKKNVMTEVYGAGADAKLSQIKDYLNDNLQEKLQWDEATTDAISIYLRDKIGEAMSQELSSSSTYKEWMKKIANKSAKQNRELRWKTPIIGLEVIQEEFKTKIDKISTKYNGKKYSIQIRIPTDKIDHTEQTKGISPNFIHSLDATHLFLTVLESQKKGTDSFATIHDSFGTHACDIDTLLEATKDTFVQMHKLDILTDLKSDMEHEYSIELDDIAYQDSVETFDIESVRDSLYIFS
ncbi:MAG: DNA-directed RNA polymerase [Campylobacterota bacterium]|nr:DNA-directed RNA polymerase [Campylobacterota bacterium]